MRMTDMALSKGSKIVAPFLRATSSSGKVHAVQNGGRTDRTVCGKPSTGADQPIKRFQNGVDNLCDRCFVKVTAARVERISTRKQRYNAARSAEKSAVRRGEMIDLTREKAENMTEVQERVENMMEVGRR